jgi:hypothetical protein
MSLRKAIQVIDAMESEGVIGSYALGGAMAAAIYVDPFPTQDFDFFVHLLGEVSDLDPLRPIIDYLEPLGYKIDGVEFHIEGILVQFIPFTGSLAEESTEMASVVEIDGVRLRVLSPEYLVALMIETDRSKDRLRAKMFLDQDAVNLEELEILIEKFELNEKWQKLNQM